MNTFGVIRCQSDSFVHLQMIKAVLNKFGQNLFDGVVFREAELHIFLWFEFVLRQKCVTARGLAHGGKPERNCLANLGCQFK